MFNNHLLYLEKVGHAVLAGHEWALVAEELLGCEAGLVRAVPCPRTAPERIADWKHPNVWGDA